MGVIAHKVQLPFWLEAADQGVYPFGVKVLRFIDDEQVKVGAELFGILHIALHHVVKHFGVRKVKRHADALGMIAAELVKGGDVHHRRSECDQVIGQGAVVANIAGFALVGCGALQQRQGKLRFARARSGFNHIRALGVVHIGHPLGHAAGKLRIGMLYLTNVV